ncbi:hypothetical protein NUU61_004506 [Penicillium alfredii]|uniref:tRNA-splicing endonuclease subunit Sen54 N-terminal domain-containing protein n=1 Tax=Penicillium alfredii TaxID=1506179 RepID=A0A9W9KDF1_9EURO|nr:uncharacterized protein NUU61_004506 [Penicillium alfredii]KAJ5102284.1 hypothetical protein NUU61_004506 [Penicillium alfredii]
MADADEDAIRAPSNNPAQIETDLSDETQDFRLLSHLNFLSDPSSGSLPRRGEKDFEPNPTEFQADVLSASRQAMHNALAYPRIHNPKNQIVGIYAPEGPTPPPQVIGESLKTVDEQQKSTESAPPAQSKPESIKPDGKGVGVSPETCVYVPTPKGQYFKTMGQADRWNRVWLLPEEALYLLERGSLDIRWPSSLIGSDSNSESGVSTDEPSIPMSLQAAYACFIGRAGLTLERFSVYTGLRRLGYMLIRAPGWHDSIEQSETAPATSGTQKTATQPPSAQRGPGLAGIFGRVFQWIHDPMSTASTTAGPVAGLGIHRNYADVYRKLALIPWYDPVTAPEPHLDDTTPPFRIVFHVYKPSTTFKKTAPPPPDFRIAVLSTRDQTSFPTLSQLGALLESTPLDPPRGDKMDRLLYMRLRHGYRHVILAVVDQGVVSYLRVADSAFGKEKLYEAKNGPSGTKRNRFSHGSKRR